MPKNSLPTQFYSDLTPETASLEEYFSVEKWFRETDYLERDAQDFLNMCYITVYRSAPEFPLSPAKTIVVVISTSTVFKFVLNTNGEAELQQEYKVT